MPIRSHPLLQDAARYLVGLQMTPEMNALSVRIQDAVEVAEHAIEQDDKDGPGYNYECATIATLEDVQKWISEISGRSVKP
jgi:hypothetical protein